MKSSKQDNKSSLYAFFKGARPLTRADIVIAAILLVAAVLSAVFAYTGKKPGSSSEIYIEGQLVGTYSLDQEKTVTFDCGVTVEINHGTAAVIESDCPDRLCVQIGAASKAGERIVCAPNKFVLVIRGENESGYDAVTGRGAR